MVQEGGFDSVPEKSIILVEEESGCMKDFYAQKLAVENALAGKKVVYITTHYGEDILADMARYGMKPPAELQIIERIRNRDQVQALCRGDLCIIDPFSTLFLETGTAEFRKMLDWMEETSRKGMTLLLISDMGVLSAEHERLLRAVSDKVIRFLTLQEGDKIKRYLYIPKIRGSVPLDKMLPFTITYEGMLIDTRERHG